MTTNAERQRLYRERHLVEGTDARLNAIVSAHAKAALKRLARHYDVTERAMLETLLAQAESDLVDRFNVKEMRRYYGVTE